MALFCAGIKKDSVICLYLKILIITIIIMLPTSFSHRFEPRIFQ